MPSRSLIFAIAIALFAVVSLKRSTAAQVVTSTSPVNTSTSPSTGNQTPPDSGGGCCG